MIMSSGVDMVREEVISLLRFKRSSQNVVYLAGAMAQWLRALASIAGDPGSVPSTHTLTHCHYSLHTAAPSNRRHNFLLSAGTRHPRGPHASKTLIHMINKPKNKFYNKIFWTPHAYVGTQ